MQTESGTHVYKINADSFVCGVCHYNCEDVISLLEHKSQHSIHLGNHVYKCELCKEVFSSTELLKEHYHNIHKITLWFTQPLIDKQHESMQSLGIVSSQVINCVNIQSTDGGPYGNTEHQNLLCTYADKTSILELDGISAEQQNGVKIINVELVTEDAIPIDDNVQVIQQFDLKNFTQTEANVSECTNIVYSNADSMGNNDQSIKREVFTHNESEIVFYNTGNVGNDKEFIKGEIVIENEFDVGSTFQESVEVVGNIQNDGCTEKIVFDNTPVEVTVHAMETSQDLEEESNECSDNVKPTDDDDDDSLTAESSISEMPLDLKMHSNTCQVVNESIECVNTLKVHGDKIEMSSTGEDFAFLLVTESSANVKNLYLKTWLVCIHCYKHMCSRDAFIKHVTTEHKNLSKTVDEDDIPKFANDILEHTGLLKKKADDVKFTKTLMSMIEYDQLLPVTSTSRSKSEIKTDDNEPNKTLKTPYKTERRLEKQDLLGSFPCEICQKVFSRLRYLRRHVKLHEEDNGSKESEVHVCNECGKEYARIESLKVHKKKHLTDCKFHCPSCEFASRDKKAIFLHRQIHPAGSVLCHICGNAYGDRPTLTKHMVVHDHRRPYKCKQEGCSWRFKTDALMNAHYQIHLNTQGKFVCQYCGKAFRRKHHLNRHQVQVHGTAAPKPKPYSNQFVNEDLVEIPSDQLEINEATFIDQPIFVTLGTQDEPIVYETSDFSSMNTFIQSNLIENVNETGFEQETQVMITTPL